MHLDALNRADAAAAAAALAPCAEVPRWVHALVAGRPYDDVDDLLGRADALARAWTDDDVLGALAQHPRIGERSDRGGTEAAMSASEQSDVGDDDDTEQRLKNGNAAYEERFGHVFLVRAAGRTGPEVLDALERRLGHDAPTELAETSGQLREIALLRLRQVVGA